MSFTIRQVDESYLDKMKMKDLSKIRFPKSFKTKISMSKVNLPIIKQWTVQNLNKLLPDDDIVIDFLFELLKENDSPDIKNIQLQLQSFLDEDAARFCKDLWNLLISAQDDPDGIPAELIEERKRQIEQIETQSRIKDNKRIHPTASGGSKSQISDPNQRSEKREKNAGGVHVEDFLEAEKEKYLRVERQPKSSGYRSHGRHDQERYGNNHKSQLRDIDDSRGYARNRDEDSEDEKRYGDSRRDRYKDRHRYRHDHRDKESFSHRQNKERDIERDQNHRSHGSYNSQRDFSNSKDKKERSRERSPSRTHHEKAIV